MVRKDVEMLLSGDIVREKIKQLALEVDKYYQDHEGIVMVGVLKGVHSLYGELLKQLKSFRIVDFIVASSYVGTQTTNEIKIIKDINSSVEGKDVLLVDTILDTGLTLDFLTKMMLEKGAKSVKSLVLINKKAPRLVEFEADFVGFEVENFYLVGYGLDVNGKHRELDYVGIYKGS